MSAEIIAFDRLLRDRHTLAGLRAEGGRVGVCRPGSAAAESRSDVDQWLVDLMREGGIVIAPGPEAA